VLYMLHGYGGGGGAKYSLGLGTVSDRLITSGTINPLIIVSPAIEKSFGINSIPGEFSNAGDVDEGLYEDYIITEMIPYVENQYSAAAAKESRYIGGFSMGGYAALYLGFTHSDLFSKIGGHSSALWDYTAADLYTNQRDWLYGDDEHRNLRDPFRLAVSQELQGIQIYLDVGSADGLAGVNERLYGLLESAGIPAEWHLNSGGHNMSYWSDHLEDYLLFYAGEVKD
jgi:enterochelin esterase-like enzyme